MITIRLCFSIICCLGLLKAGIGFQSISFKFKRSMKASPVSIPKLPLSRQPLFDSSPSSESMSLRPSAHDRARTIANICGSGTLCTTSSLPDMQGHPFGSYVDFITDEKGWPVLLLSNQSLHSQNIHKSEQVSLFCILPRLTNTQSSAGLSRVTIMGSVIPVPASESEVLKLAFSIVHPYTEQLTKHHRFSLHRIKPSKVYLSGGFGVGATWVDISKYEQGSPDVIAHEGVNVLGRVNSEKQGELMMLCKQFLGLRADEVDDVRIVGIDRLGIDLRITSGDFCDEYRVGFRLPAKSAEDVKSELLKLFHEAWERDQGLFVSSDGSTVPGDGEPMESDDDYPPIEKYAEDILRN